MHRHDVIVVHVGRLNNSDSFGLQREDTAQQEHPPRMQVREEDTAIVTGLYFSSYLCKLTSLAKTTTQRSQETKFELMIKASYCAQSRLHQLDKKAINCKRNTRRVRALKQASHKKVTLSCISRDFESLNFGFHLARSETPISLFST